VAGDGQLGLHRALTCDYAVLVVDCGLPAIDGLDLITRLRSRGVQVLVLSARPPGEDLTGICGQQSEKRTFPFGQCDRPRRAGDRAGVQLQPQPTTEDTSLQTSFVVDDTAVTLS
jgi:CheY-like chemotaxis protein